MVPGERIELPTNGLQNRCSTAELTRRTGPFKTSGRKRPCGLSLRFFLRPQPASPLFSRCLTATEAVREPARDIVVERNHETTIQRYINRL
jgi:hypothetical protein